MNTPPPRGFPEAEFAARTERAQALMAEAGIDALWLTTEADLRYFSGFLTQFWQSPTRPWYLIVPRRGRPVAVIPEIGAACMARTWVEDIRTWPAPAARDDGVSLLAGALAEIAGPRGRIGLPTGRETHLRMPRDDFAALEEHLPDAAFVSDGGIVRRLRLVKSEAEIGKIAFACSAASDAFEDAPALFAVGMSEAEIFRAFKKRLLDAGVDDVSYLVGGAGPGGPEDIISPPSDRPTEAGDVLILDTGSVFDGYFCDFDRNWALGRADDAAQRAYATVWRATEAGLAACRPGARASDLFQAMQAVLAEGGALGNDVGRLGHGLGMQLTEAPSHTEWDDTVLEAGMVLTLEPGMTFAPGKVMVHEENLVLREDGPELLSRRAPPDLPVI